MSIKKYTSGSWVTVPYRKYGTDTDTITSLPKTIIGDGQPISSYTIKGNMSQSGTPTPSNPVYPVETGDKTANLCNGVFEQGTLSEGSATGSTYEQTKSSSITTNRIRTAQLVTCGGEVTISCDFTKYQLYILYYDANGQYTGQHSSSWNSSAVTTNQQYIGIAIRRLNDADLSPNETDIKLMVNTGSTAKPYEPYGYKIPISSNGVTTNIYLTEQLMKIGDTVDSLVSTGTVTYNIKKLVLTGQENIEWKKSTAYLGGFYTSWRNSFSGINNGQFYCSHAQYVSDITDYQQGTCYSDGSCNIRIMPDSSTVQDWINYLATQYANGTPVTIVYILLTPTTKTVTAPSIPTTEGANSITVDTTVQPSEFTATWTGWHDSSVKEYDGTNWQ